MKKETKSELQFRYLRTTQLLKAEDELSLSEMCKIRLFKSIEAAKFTEDMRKSNAVARLGGSNNYYLNQAHELNDQTIVEIYKVANANEILKVGEDIALWAEKLAILSSIFTIQRNNLHRKLGINSNITSEINFAVTSKFKTIRSSSQRAPKIEGIKINKQFCKRFDNCGFKQLFQYVQENGDLNKRVITSANWLIASRREPNQNASVVKTAIALESLLIFSESESLARTLSERSAFILSNSPTVREKISRIILRFYDVRSGIVHGSKNKAKKLTPTLVECVDRLTLLIHLLIAYNARLWESVDSLRLWCEKQKWGIPYSDVKFPFSQIYLKNALTLVDGEMK